MEAPGNRSLLPFLWAVFPYWFHALLFQLGRFDRCNVLAYCGKNSKVSPNSKNERASPVSEDVEFDYDFLMQNALRGLMRDVLSMVAELGDAPGEHHFFVEYLTGAPDVDIPDFLREEYPERMTIVLQHQFEDLQVNEDDFTVTLWFKGKRTRLHIPFDAVTSFADPSVQFGVRFELAEAMADAASEKDGEDGDSANNETVHADITPKDTSTPKDASDDTDQSDGDTNDGDGADIVSLDAFRKK